jgi:hypothetical protein
MVETYLCGFLSFFYRQHNASVNLASLGHSVRGKIAEALAEGG